MKYRILFIIAVLWPVALLEAGHPPLTIYYHFEDEKYGLTKPENKKDTEQLADFLTPENPKLPKVVYCCPAETDDQKEIQDRDITFQALFVKVQNNPDDPKEKIECTYKYKTSMRKKSNDEVLIGYAIHESHNTDIDWPKRNIEDKNFIWVFEKQIKYKYNDTNAIRSVHYIFPKQHTSEGACPNYDFGSNIVRYTQSDIERFYSRKNQDKVFEYVQRPVTGSYEEDVLVTNDSEYRHHKQRTETVNRDAYEEVTIHQLIPIADFSEKHLKMETCFYLNVIPVWNSIHVGSLTKVEKYIRGIVDKLPANNSLQNKLKVRTMVQEKILDKRHSTVYLDRQKLEYPVYRMIIKIISYLYSPFESNQPQEPQQQSQPELQQKSKEKHLYIAIVIHNELYSPQSTLCKVNVCGQLGWNVASIEGGLTYCCLLDDLPSLVESEPFDLNEILPNGVHPSPPPVGAPGTNPAIIVLYYPQDFSHEGTYRYVDIKQSQELHLPSDATSQFTDILLYCPPETIDQEVSASILKVDLTFVRKIVKTVEDIGDPNICVNRYKPAVWCGSFNTYHVGYLVSEHEASMKTQRIYSSPEKQQKEYRGVTLFWIHYSTYEVRPGHSEHVMTSKKQSPGIDDLCENDMKTGLENIRTITESTFIDAYSKENQKKNLDNYVYDSSKYYFVKKLLVPSDDFDDYGRKLATCSYMNTYPVWNIVNHALLGVEKYLRKILGKLKSVDEFFIHTRLIDTLLLPVRSPRDSPMATNQDKENSPDPGLEAVHLSPSQSEIPVPARIVKIIGHRVPLPQKQDQGSNYIQYKYYFMAIVFENKIEKELNRWEKCKQVVDCIDYGWDMKEWEWAGNRPYCCGLEVIPYGEKEDKLPFTAQGQYEILDLKNVVIDLGEQNVTQDIASLVNDQPIGLEEGSG